MVQVVDQAFYGRVLQVLPPVCDASGARDPFRARSRCCRAFDDDTVGAGWRRNMTSIGMAQAIRRAVNADAMARQPVRKVNSRIGRTAWKAEANRRARPVICSSSVLVEAPCVVVIAGLPSMLKGGEGASLRFLYRANSCFLFAISLCYGDFRVPLSLPWRRYSSGKI